MIGNRERFTTKSADSRSLTVLDCEIGNHTGHFPITRVELFGRKLWGCDPCIAEKGAHR